MKNRPIIFPGQGKPVGAVDEGVNCGPGYSGICAACGIVVSGEGCKDDEGNEYCSAFCYHTRDDGKNETTFFPGSRQ